MSKYLIIILIFVTAFFESPALKAQATVRVSIDTNIMLIGDHTNVMIEAVVPPNYSVELPVFTDTIINKLEILNILDQDTILVDNMLKIQQQYQVINFDSGWYTIPPFKFAVRDTLSNQVDTFYSQPVYFGVMTMPLDTVNADAIADIKAPIEAPLTLHEVLPFLLIGIGVLLVLFLAYFLYMRFARKEPVFVKKEKPKEPAHVIAFRELDKLKELKLWQQGKNKEFYSELTDIIRTYMENRYNIYAMEMTTDEIIQVLGVEKIIEKDMKDELFDVLTRADFVKFAKATTLANENEASMKFAYEFVIKTKVEVVITEGKENNESDVEPKGVELN